MLSLLSITCVDRVPIGTNDAHRTRDGLIDPNTSPAVVSAFRWTGYPRLRALRRWSAGDPARPSSSIRTYRAVGLASLYSFQTLLVDANLWFGDIGVLLNLTSTRSSFDVCTDDGFGCIGAAAAARSAQR